jgi:hypothetical protein
VQPPSLRGDNIASVQRGVLRGGNAWHSLSSQDAEISRDFWESVQDLSPGRTKRTQSRDPRDLKVRVVGQARRGSVIQCNGEIDSALKISAVPVALQTASATAGYGSQAKKMLCKHGRVLAAIEEREKQWKIKENVSILFDIIDENDGEKCQFRDVVLWIRRDHHHLHRLPVLLHAYEDATGQPVVADSFITRPLFPALLSAILRASRVWVLFDCLVGDHPGLKDNDKALSKERFVCGLRELCGDVLALDLEQLWFGMSEVAQEAHAVSFGAFCKWLTGCEQHVQQHILKCCVAPPTPSALADTPAAYCIVKPHILSLIQSSDSGSALNLDHFNLGPHEMAAWAPVFSSTEISEIRLSHNRISQCIQSLLPAFAGHALGGVGDGVTKLYVVPRPRKKETVSRVMIVRSLSGCDLDAAAAILLSRAFSVAVNLESLDLSQNRCGDHGTVAVCRSLMGNTKLLKLNLRQNEIGSRGGKGIGEMLASPGLRLRKLNVSWNSIRGHGASALFKALGDNKSVQLLDASWNFVGEKCAVELGNALASNKSMLNVNLQHCGLNDVAAVQRATPNFRHLPFHSAF